MLTRLLRLLTGSSTSSESTDSGATLSNAEQHWQQYLLERKRLEETQLKQQGLDTLSNLLTRAIHDDDARVRREAVIRIADKCQEFVSSGADTEEVRFAVSAMARLWQTDSDESVHHNIGMCLEKTGHPRNFMADVIDATRSEHASVRRAAVGCLARLDAEAVDAVSDLIRLSRDAEEPSRIDAIGALGGIGPPGAEAVPTLISALESPDIPVRSAAAKALGGIQSNPEIAVPALIRALCDAENFLEPGANASMFPDPNEFSMDPPAIRWECAPIHFVVAALRHFPVAAVAAVPELLTVLQYDDQLSRGLCLVTLGRIGHQDAVPAVMKLLADLPTQRQLSATQSAVREEAIHTLGAIGPPASAATPILKDMLVEPNLYAVAALAQIGTNAHSAVPVLLELLHSQEKGASVATAAALLSISGQTDEVFDVLHTVITDQSVDDANRVRSCELLMNYDQSNADAVVPMLLQLADRSPFAIKLLGRCGTTAAQAIPGLESTLRSTQWDKEHALQKAADYAQIDMALAAALALARIRQDVSTVLPLLIDRLRDKSANTRSKVAITIGAIGPAASDALPALRVAISDSDRNVRNCATRAVKLVEDEAEESSETLVSSHVTPFSMFVWPSGSF